MEKQKINFEIYSKEHYDKVFAEIESLSDLLNPNEILDEIQKRFNLTILIGQSFNKLALDTIELYRLRVPKSIETFNEYEISSFSYPPEKSMIKEKGRANIENEQVFYASADNHTVFYEMKSHINIDSNIAYLSKWGIKSNTKTVFIRNLFLGIPDDTEEYSSIMANGLKQAIEANLSSMSEQHRENFIYGMKKYTELFTLNGNKFYHLSSAIAHDTFINAKKHKVDIPILTYPSIAKNKSAINFAIRKDFADKNLFLKEVYKVLVKEIGEKKIEFTIIAKGIIDHGKVKWYYPKMTINYRVVFISPDGDPKNMSELKKGESLTLCCKEHIIDTEQLLKKMDFTDSALRNIVTKALRNIETVPQIFNCLIPISINFNLYKDSDISEKGKINYIMLLLRCNFDFECPDSAN